jgi:5'-methylthioadenosine phosphorylase
VTRDNFLIAVITEGDWRVGPGFTWGTAGIRTSVGEEVAVRTLATGLARALYFPHAGKRSGVPPSEVAVRVFEVLEAAGVQTVLYFALAGGINTLLRPGDLMVPGDIIDMTRHRPRSFKEDPRGGVVLYYRADEPFCPRLRRLLVRACRDAVAGAAVPTSSAANVFDGGVCVVTEGPRFETVSEIQAFRGWGGDACCHNIVPEAFFARECGMCFGAVVGISNYAEGAAPPGGGGSSYRLVEDVLATVFPRVLAAVAGKLGAGPNQGAAAGGDRCGCASEDHWILRPTARGG